MSKKKTKKHFKFKFYSIKFNQLTTIFHFPQPTSSSLSLSDPALHSDWLDDSLLAELYKTEPDWLVMCYL